MRTNRISVQSALGLSLLVLGLNSARADLPADTGIGQTTLAFPAEPHRAFVVDVEFESFVAGRVTVVDPDQKRVLGMVPTGFAAPSALSHDGKLIYSADIWYSRGTRGTRTDVLTAWDSSTLSPAWEVLIPNKRAESLTQRYGLKTSGDDRFVYVYNFTPSTSVTVVDTQTKAVASEIAIPGCVLNYPVGKRRFASLCGDGSLQVVTLNDQGQETARNRTPFFDPNAEKLVERAVNVGDTYYFTTTTGTVRAVDFSADAPKILPSWSLVTDEEKKAGWAPGGWQLMAVAPKLNRLYVLMHDAHEPMKWEDPSPLIWAFDLKTGKKIATLEAPVPVWSMQATGDDKPLLLGTDVEGGLQIFDLKTNQHTGSMAKVAKTATQVMSY
ncbi:MULTISPECIES: amine dehydrogenase large subunit [Pseudomonas]|uniref:amine dehydrogenase large subunit n=1 Tax=Pseudomonas TaxID=286 RepID=UPI000D80D002|nr:MULTISPECIES: amine dehydrogenase large subunit [Pseudomonas]MDP9688659.1 methylamine dehydrogenase heavy chain [Pseudomonas mohnii]MBD0681026.1 amine dehydrogenase [Pseudomonas sp. PSB11]MCK8685471.1 amine dehydrogenase [Pseudomonas umsongensis]MDI3392438.1 amine dehydrogenase large subunit [Pseudomonas sp. V98_8]NWL19989.1 amine dehydrogenase [Pseudomonas umsongensis]